MQENEKKVFALRAQSKGTIESFLSKKVYNKIKISFALRAQRRGTTESFLTKNGYSKSKKLVFRAMRTTKSNILSTIHLKYMIFAKTMVEIPFVEKNTRKYQRWNLTLARDNIKTMEKKRKQTHIFENV